MKIAPLSWNFNGGSQTTDVTPAAELSRGYPSANSANTDMGKRVEFRGAVHVEAGVNDKSDITDSVAGAVTATLNAGTYNSVAEWCQELTRAHNSATSTAAYSFWQEQHPTSSTHRIRCARSGGTVALRINTGANAATNALYINGGYRNADRSAAASHVGDLAATGDWDRILIDFGGLTTRFNGDGTFIVEPRYSPNAAFTVRGGNTSTTNGAGSSTEWIVGSHHDDRILFLPYTSSAFYRYIELRIRDPHRESPARGSIAYWYHGPIFDTARSSEVEQLDYEWQSYKVSHLQRARVQRGISGQPHWADVRPGMMLNVAMSVSPGLSANYAAGLRNLVDALGMESLAFVCLDATNEPHRDTFLARVAAPPVFTRIAATSRLGREALTLQFEVVER